MSGPEFAEHFIRFLNVKRAMPEIDLTDDLLMIVKPRLEKLRDEDSLTAAKKLQDEIIRIERDFNRVI